MGLNRTSSDFYLELTLNNFCALFVKHSVLPLWFHYLSVFINILIISHFITAEMSPQNVL